MELLVRFVVGGTLVFAFALLGDIVRPRGFAGLFGAAPSVALASLALTIQAQGIEQAQAEARSMIGGAIAFCCYALACTYAMSRLHWKSGRATVWLLGLWGLIAFGLWATLLDA